MPQTIRVLHVFGRLDAGGAETRTMEIYRKINKEKIQFDFAIHTEDDCFFSSEIKALGGKIYNFPRFNGKNYIEYKQSWDSFYKNHPEIKIVHGHQTSTGFVFLREAKRNNTPIRIAHARNSNKDNYIKKLTTKFAKFYATDLLAVSKLAGKSEFGDQAVSSNKVKIIPNAIDAARYIFNADMRLLKREELKIKDEFVIIHVGRFHKQKNHKFLLNIFSEVLKKNPNSKLLLIGDGFLKNEIIETIDSLGIENSVTLLGVREDVADLMQAADLLLFPSLYEGFPGVVLEAQASGLPCLISDTITNEIKITDLVEYVSLKENKQHWADKVLAKQDTILRKNTYKRIADSGYDINGVATFYEQYYRNLI